MISLVFYCINTLYSNIVDAGGYVARAYCARNREKKDGSIDEELKQ